MQSELWELTVMAQKSRAKEFHKMVWMSSWGSEWRSRGERDKHVHLESGSCLQWRCRSWILILHSCRYWSGLIRGVAALSAQGHFCSVLHSCRPALKLRDLPESGPLISEYLSCHLLTWSYRLICCFSFCLRGFRPEEKQWLFPPSRVSFLQCNLKLFPNR